MCATTSCVFICNLELLRVRKADTAHAHNYGATYIKVLIKVSTETPVHAVCCEAHPQTLYTVRLEHTDRAHR